MAGSGLRVVLIANSNKLSSVEVYDAVTKKWETVQSMTKKRFISNLVVMEDELYAVGGDEYGSTSISIEKLDKELGVWRVVAEIREVRHACGAVSYGQALTVPPMLTNYT